MGDDLRNTLNAVEICIAQEEWDRAEDGLLHVLGEVRKRQGQEASADD